MVNAGITLAYSLRRSSDEIFEYSLVMQVVHPQRTICQSLFCVDRYCPHEKFPQGVVEWHRVSAFCGFYQIATLFKRLFPILPVFMLRKSKQMPIWSRKNIFDSIPCFVRHEGDSSLIHTRFHMNCCWFRGKVNIRFFQFQCFRYTES